MIRRVEGRRLAFYGPVADEHYWSDQWRSLLTKEYFRDAETGVLGWFEEPFIRYLPKKGRILEAGCGTGQYVLALRRRGYDVEGVEWSKKTVRAIKKMYHSLPIRVGDVTKLSVKDGYYSGYISLGVIEHRGLGPRPFLREAWRVLQPGGIALISVPHFNFVRRIKAMLGFYSGNIPKDLCFYQFAYMETELDDILRRASFEVIDHFRYDGVKGLKDDFRLLRPLVAGVSSHRTSNIHPDRKSQGEKRKRTRPKVLTILDFVCGHMTMVICRKPL